MILSGTGQVRVLGTAETDAWRAYLARIPRRDITYDPAFLRVYEEKGDGQGECFVFEQGDQLVVYPYIRRFLAQEPVFGPAFAPWCDLVTPYCYGGFIHNAKGKRKSLELLQAFRATFENHAKETHVVSEFIRFHPHLATQEHLTSEMRLLLHRQNIIWDLTQDEAALLHGCRRSYRSCIRQGQQAGLRLLFDASPEAVSTFAMLYHQTMTRHQQHGYLNFPETFFHLLVKHLGESCLVARVLLDGVTCAMGLFLRHGDYLDYFLSASDPQQSRWWPNHVMLYEVACWGHQHGVRILHLGGGNDSLHFFKRGFSSVTCPYYLGEKIHDPAVCEKLVRHRFPGMDDNGIQRIPYMPAYRYGLE